MARPTFKLRDFCFVPATLWDGETYFHDPSWTDGDNRPSASSTEFKPVVGDGTEYPAGFTLPELFKIMFRIRLAKFSMTVGTEWLSGYSEPGHVPIYDNFNVSLSAPVVVGNIQGTLEYTTASDAVMTDALGNEKENALVVPRYNLMGGGLFINYGYWYLASAILSTGVTKDDYSGDPYTGPNYTAAELLALFSESGDGGAQFFNGGFGLGLYPTMSFEGYHYQVRTYGGLFYPMLICGLNTNEPEQWMASISTRKPKIRPSTYTGGGGDFGIQTVEEMTGTLSVFGKSLKVYLAGFDYAFSSGAAVDGRYNPTLMTKTVSGGTSDLKYWPYKDADGNPAL